jgi:predicted transcriptional regulator
MAADPKFNPKMQLADPERLAEVNAARLDVDAGRTVPYEQVRRWLQSWGTENELPRPRCK